MIQLFVIFVLSTLTLALAGAPPGPEKAYNDAGYISVYNEKRHLFYWFFESRSNPETDPVILWMSGGPGCSGQVAMFGENGPYKINGDDLSLSLNPYSWNNNATVIWIDQPAGSGFSTGPFITNEDQMANDMFEFLTKFFAKYEAMGKKYDHLPFHIIGESYAGHYVPALSAKVLRESKSDNAPLFSKSYVGSAMGNGLTDPLVQFKYYGPYLEMYNKYGPNGQAISKTAIDIMKVADPACEALIYGCNLNKTKVNGTVRYLVCVNAYVACAYTQLIPVQLSGLNPYDIREKCPPGLPLCYNFTAITAYLNQPSVREALGTGSRKWSSCNRLVDMTMVYAGDWMLDFQSDVEYLLENGKKVLVYAGEFDFICNWLGNYEWTQQFQWSGHDKYVAQANHSFVTDAGKQAGVVKSYGGLTFLKVFNAGHMVPRDVPDVALDFVQKFTTDQEL